MKKIVYLIILSTLFFSSCQKKGHIDVKNSGFWINNCTAPFEVQFYLEVGYQPKEISYLWDFGDGTTSDEKEPLHNYTKTGKYNVKLTIVNYKTVENKTFTIDVSQDPMTIVSDFDYESIHGKYYAPCEIQFTNTSQYASNFFWNFGDGHGSEETNPTHIFESAGTYNVYLHAICNGDTVSSLLRMDIAPPPSQISVDVVSIWFPDEYLDGLFELHYYIGNYNETPASLDAVNVTDFPFGWVINKDLSYFDGNYDSRSLYFEVTDYYNDTYPIYSFGEKFEDIQNAFYPDTLSWDNGQGFAAEVLVSYKD